MRNALLSVTIAVFALLIVLLVRSNHAPTSAIATTPPPSVDVAGRRPIRFATTAAYVSENGKDVYHDVVAYFQQKLGRPCELVEDLSYRTVNSMLASGAIDVGFICGLPYVVEADQSPPHIRIVAAPVMRAPHYENRPEYFTYLIARPESPYTDFRSLRGCAYAYNDEYSNAGYAVPASILADMGETPDYFGHLIRTGSHEASIHKVAVGEADAACVSSQILDFDLFNNDPDARAVRIIERIGPEGAPPVVVSATMPAELEKEISRVFLGMHEDPRGRVILARALLQKFVEVPDSNYDSIRRRRAAGERAGLLHLR
ncbi:MAG TPA: PhnD/SsuA/transferrin family substrate-binding protein [Phycisphaerae bacterium]|nr:PhnD/SsuA/transferrin family substrate-binding protein [Phycisphaerae bacterium]HRW53530.1 PhnD/SsuA/transferrin family substrate-binding protein [Phycisphaerae bacterium]